MKRREAGHSKFRALGHNSYTHLSLTRMFPAQELFAKKHSLCVHKKGVTVGHDVQRGF